LEQVHLFYRRKFLSKAHRHAWITTESDYRCWKYRTEAKNLRLFWKKVLALIKELLHVPDDYSILFLQGGANMQFNMIPYNILNDDETANFVETDIWSTRAEEETRLYGNTHIIASSKESNFNYIPKDFKVDEKATYLHLTSNNTIYGTEFFEDKQYSVPVVS
jgi:phosphoserine aminotransferase